MVPTPANCRPLSPERLTAHRRKRTRPVISDGLCVLVRKNPSIPDRDRDDLFVGVQVEEPSASVSVGLSGFTLMLVDSALTEAIRVPSAG